jgi:RNA polymerase sigma-70 factor (ECF subfamily)
LKDEAELVAAALAGDEDAFTALYQAHAGYVQAIGRSILRNDELEDMCQETFLSAFRRLDSFESNARFRTWITRIAINQCRLVLRRRRQGSNGDCQLVQMDFQGAEDDVLFRTRDVELENVPARLDVQRILRRLPSGQRRLLEMAYLEDLPGQEIADLLGISVRELKGQLYRVRQRVLKK